MKMKIKNSEKKLLRNLIKNKKTRVSHNR